MFPCDDEIDGKRRSGIGCYGNNGASGSLCLNHLSCSEVRIPSCNCQSNVGCLDRSDCGGLRPTGTAATGACPGPCQCVEEEIWNSNAPPKPNCQWLSNFAELRRQWSNHSRQHACKCCSCSRSCKTVVPCRLCLSPTPPCSSTALISSDCQRCYGSRRLSGGASKSEMTSIDKSSSPERPLKREAGGGCPPPSCPYPSTRCNFPNADCSSSTTSSYCPSQCRYSQASSCQTPSTSCQRCVSSAYKSILKKRSCCQCNTSNCMCQPMPRGCNCPPPVQVDVRAGRKCSCECPSSPECACPPSERRFPKTMIKCPNARLCCPFPRLPPDPKCHCARCQPCPPPPCNPCTFTKCRVPVASNTPCCPRLPCPLCSPCRQVMPPAASPCRSLTPCKKLTFCAEQSGRPSSSPCTGTGQSSCGIIGYRNSENDVSNGRYNVDEERGRYDTTDCLCDKMCCCVIDHVEIEGGSKHNNKSCDPILDIQYPISNINKVHINENVNLSEIAEPLKSVDPDSHGISEKGSKSAPVTETVMNTSSAHVPSDNLAKLDHNTVHGKDPLVDKTFVDPVLKNITPYYTGKQPSYWSK